MMEPEVDDIEKKRNDASTVSQKVCQKTKYITSGRRLYKFLRVNGRDQRQGQVIPCAATARVLGALTILPLGAHSRAGR